MNQLTIFNKDQEIKSLLEKMEKTSAIASGFRFLLDKFNELTGTEFKGSELYHKGTDEVFSVDEVEKLHKRVGFLSTTSMQYRLDAAGVKTIREEGKVDLEYNGKIIARPMVNGCPQVIKREFGIEI